MVCKLGNTDEEIKAAVQVIIKHVSGELAGITANKEAFDLDKYIYGIYDYVRKGTDSPATAFAYAQMIPFALLQTIQNSKATRDYLKGKVDRDTLQELSDSFLADIQNVIDHLGYTPQEVADLTEIEEANRQMKMAPDRNKEPISEAFDFSFVPRKGTWESTTSNETITRTPQELVDSGEEKNLDAAYKRISRDPRAYQLSEGNRGIINPQMAPYFDFIRDAINIFNSQPDMANDSRKLKSTVVKDGFHLTAMSGRRIPADQLDSNTRRWLSIGDEYTQRMKKKDIDNTLVFAVTDANNVPIHFDRVANKLVQVKPTATSKMIYYTLNRPDMVDGKIDYKRSGMMTPAELIKSRGIKLKPEAYKAELKRIEEEYAEQEKTLSEIEKFIKKAPDKNQVKAFAIGGSLGTIKKNKTKTSLKEFNLGRNPVFYIIDIKGASDEGYVYLKTDSISSGVPVWNRNINRPEADMIADFLTEDVYDGGKLLTAQSKYDRIYPFVQIKNPNGLSVKVLGNILDIKIGENYYTISDQTGKARTDAIALAKKEIVKVLSKPYYRIPMPETSASAINNIVKNTGIKLWDSKDVNITDSNENDIVAVKKAGETIYYRIHKPTWNIDKLVESDTKLDDFTNYNITELNDKKVIGYKDETKKQVYYSDWVINNAQTYAGMNAEKQIMALNPYFEVAYDQDDIAAMSAVKVDTEAAKKAATAARDKVIKEAPKTSIDEEQFVKDNPDLFEKNLRQKGINVKATMDQIAVAKAWWPNSPLSKHIAFNAAFSLVNTSSPNAIAQFTTTGGILLNKGSDYTDTYHEAWHGFTQMFLTKEQKDSLYKDTAKQSGTFTDNKGSTVSFQYASRRQLEEYLAEEFREFMLKDGKVKTASPVRNKIFQFILDVLNALFEGVSIRQAIIDRKSNKNIHDLFEKLRVGNIHEYTFSEANADFKTLNKGITATDTKDPDDHLSYSESKLIADTMDVIISEMEFNGRRLTNPAKAMKNPKIMTMVYAKVFERLARMRNETQIAYDAETDNFKKNDIKFNLDTLDYVVKYYGSMDNKKQLLAEKGVIAYHLRKTRYLKRKDKFALFDKMQEDLESKRDHLNREGNKNSLEYLASEDIVALMRTLYKKEGPKGEGLNRFGVHEFESERTTWNSVAKILEGVEHKEKMYELMLENSHETLNPHAYIFAQLAAKLGNPMVIANNLNHEKFRVWEEFKQAFDRIRIRLKQVTIDKIVDDSSEDDLDFSAKKAATFTIHTGETTGREKNIIRNWESNFRILTTNLIKNSPEGHYLDLEQLFNPKDDNGNNIASPYATATGALIKGMDRLLLADVGIDLTKHPALEAELNNEGRRGRYAPYVYNTLKKRYNEGEKKLKNLKSIFKGEETNFNKLAALEARYNPIAGFMVTTAEGNTQFEHSQQSSATRKTTAINNAESWGDLMQLKHMAHLNHDRSNHVFNFFTRGSRILESLFDSKTGKKRTVKKGEKVRFEYDNFSGISLTVNNLYHESGVAAAEADEASKILADLFTFIQGGTSEGARTSDRGTTYLYYTSDIVIAPGAMGAHTGNYYVDPAKFLSKDDESKGREERNRIMMQYVSNEAMRVDYMQNLPDDAAEHRILVNDKGLTYAEAGSKFVIFDDILLKGTKDKILASLEGYNPSDNYYDHLSKVNPELHTAITDELGAYFDKQSAAFSKKLKEIGINNAVRSPLIEALNENRMTLKHAMHDKRMEDPYTQADKLNAIVESYITNSWIHMYEGMAIFYGDMALFVDPDNFIKRITGATSPGLGFSNDASTKAYYTKLASTGDLRPYAKKYATDNPTAVVAKQLWNGTAVTSVFKDVKEQSVYLNKFSKILEKDTRERFEKANNKTLSSKQIDTIVKEEVKAYTEDKMEIGNGQGWISFDSYRILKKSMGEWSDVQEKLFQRILNGENIPAKDIMQFFPVAKYQYFGPLDTNGTPATAFHKFSLMPLVPSVIKGTELEDMHNRMVEQGIDYALFQTGSKVATLTSQTDTEGKATPDAFRVGKESAFSAGYVFTPNKIFLEYLKDQMSVPDEYKNKATFSTQLRKIIESGFMEFGVPTDFGAGKSDSVRIKAWDSMRVFDKDGSLDIDKTDRLWKKASKKYTLLSEYREQVRELTELKKQELLRDAGIELDTDGNYKGNMQQILKMVSAELESQDLSEHEIDYIQFDERTGKIRNDLSFSPSADKIERILVALVNKRLINQKVNGEGLVLVSNTGFQKSGDKFTKAAKEDLDKYGTDGLAFYDIDTDKKGNITGKRTKGMKVKVAMKGSFQRLLTHPDVVIKSKTDKITRLDALNMLIKDEKWLDKADHRQMITMVGVRIPVQGLNSMEFMEVYEFLPKEAGSILIPPAEIVAKSGSDFDIDKLMVMMPNIIGLGQGKVGMANYNEAEIKQMWQDAKTKKIEISEHRDSDGKYVLVIDDRESENLVQAIFPQFQGMPEVEFKDESGKTIVRKAIPKLEYTEEEIKSMLREEGLKPYEQFRTHFMIATTENKMLSSMVEILAHPDNFASLIRPNGTYLLHDLADELADSVRDYDPNQRNLGGKVQNAKGKDIPSSTRAFEVLFNLYKHQAHSVGKQTLGIGAVENAYNVLFNGVGAYMEAETITKVGKKSYIVPQKIYLPHNSYKKESIHYTEDKVGKITSSVQDMDVISLGHLRDANGEYVISDIISQLINGWVDVAKDTWVFDIQGNKETAPTLLFALAAGIPLKSAVYLVSNPLVRAYIKEQKIAKSEFGDVLEKSPTKWQFFRNQARGMLLTSPKYGVKWGKDIRDYNTKEMRERISKDLEKLASNLSEKSLGDRISETQGMAYGVDLKTTDTDIAALLQFLVLEDMGKATTKVKMNTNFDTKKTTTTFAAMNKELMLADLKQGGQFPGSVVERILNESPIGSFNIQKFIRDIWTPLFAVRNNEYFNDFILSKLNNPATRDDIESTFGDGQGEKFVEQMRNDFASFVYQNAIREFDLSKETTYRGYRLDKKIPVQTTDYLPIGAFVKGDVLYVNDKAIRDDFSRIRAKSTLPTYKKHSLGPVERDMFDSVDEYRHFVIERAYLLSVWTIDQLEGRSDYETYLKDNKKQEKPEEYAYQLVIRDMALDNTFNAWKTFKSDNNAAYEYQRIKKNNPELIKRYPVLEALVVSKEESSDIAAGIKNKNELKNIRLQNSNLTGVELEMFHDNLTELSNDTRPKVVDRAENQRISDFFKRLPYVAIMQSGLDTTTIYSMGRMVPFSDLTLLSKKAANMASRTLSNPDKRDNLLEVFYRKFVAVNNISSFRTRTRFKDYLATEVDLRAVKNKPASTTGFITTIADGTRVYDQSMLKTDADAVKLADANPGYVFIYEGRIKPRYNKDGSPTAATSPDFAQGKFSNSNITNALAVPIRKDVLRKTNKASDHISDATLDANKQRVDDFTKALDHEINVEMRVPVWPKGGIAQALVGAEDNTGNDLRKHVPLAPETFDYLSKQLYKFGYLNKNFVETKEGTALLEERAPVTNRDIEDQLKKCYGK